MKPTPLERLLAKTVVDEATGCILFTGAAGSHGYGNFAKDGHTVRAPRAMYEAFFGPIPEGLTIDHVYARGCRHKNCVNPAHLEAVTILENIRRGSKATKTHCVNEHEFTPENTVIRPNGTRRCKTCQYARQNERAREKRALLRRAA